MATEAETNQEANTVPDWLQAELFVDVLKESVEGFAKIKSFKAKTGTVAGENFSTIMLRLSIEVELEDGTDKSVSYMLKLPHELEMYKKMLENHNIFEVERNMYGTVVPEMEQMYRDIGLDIKFGPKAYELKGAKSNYILLEDLAPKGFRNTNRRDGLDQAHTETALRKLAQFHAASVVRVATKGNYPDQFLIGFFKEENREMITEMNEGLSQNFLKCCGTYEGIEHCIEQVKAVQPKITDQLFIMSKPDPTGLNVLNHGDYWSNNMMFSYDSLGQIKEIYMVDFQISKYGTVAQDLYYFLISSTKLEDKLSKFDYYIKFYHNNLVEHLKLLKYTKPIPTLREIHISLFKYGFWGFLTAWGSMSAILADPSESSNFENFLSDTDEGNDYKTSLYTNPRYRKHIQAIIPWLFNRGAFEDL